MGDVARWVTIYERLKQLAPNELLSYEDMGGMLGLDFIDNRNAIQVAAKRAVKQLEDVDRRTCRIERGHGYRIATPDHQVALAARHQGLAASHIHRAHTQVSLIDLNKVDPETAKVVGLMAHSLAEQARFVEAVDVRQQRLEDAMRAVAHGFDERMRSHENRTAEELAAVRAELAELTRKVDEPQQVAAATSQAPPTALPAASGAAPSPGDSVVGPLFSGGAGKI